MNTFDIAIVGAGPAAATFARQMQRSGKRILLIDGQPPERPKPCGGLLAPDAQKLLAGFDFTLPNSILVDPQIFSVKTIDLCSGLTRYYPRCYLNMDRQKFNAFLLEKLTQNVTVIRGRCSHIRRTENASFELRVATDCGEKIYTSTYIVGADGASSFVRNTFFPEKRIPKYVAIQQWFPADGTQNPYYSCIFDPKTSGSCSWIIYKNGHFLYGGCFAPKNCRAMFDLQKSRLSHFLKLDLGAPERTEACLVNRPRHLRDFVTGREGVYLIGEAAGFISPSSFEGISFAMKSGILLAKAFSAGSSTQTARQYRKKTAAIRWRLWLKMRKRWFMYTPFLRFLLMKTGIADVKIIREEYEDCSRQTETDKQRC